MLSNIVAYAMSYSMLKKYLLNEWVFNTLNWTSCAGCETYTVIQSNICCSPLPLFIVGEIKYVLYI